MKDRLVRSSLARGLSGSQEMRDTLLPMSVAAIVLAAGGSRRLGQPKQLLLLEGESLIARTLRLVREAGATPVLAVLGAHADTIEDSIGAGETIVVVNENWQQGIAASINAGMQALVKHDPKTQGVLLLGCDQPRLSADHLSKLTRTFDLRKDDAIVASTYAGVQGIPAIFPRIAYPGLLALRGDTGARTLIAKPPCAVVTIPFEGGEIDIDLPQDLAQIR
jgi:CTP:molybdopterin cytidylyltransferase MocA